MQELLLSKLEHNDKVLKWQVGRKKGDKVLKWQVGRKKGDKVLKWQVGRKRGRLGREED